MLTSGRQRPGGVLLALLALLASLATGCQARLEIDVVVEPDGAGTLAVSLAADAALLQEARRRGGDPLDGVAATGRRLAASGWTVEDTTADDGSRDVRLSTAFAGPDEFNALAADLAAALAAPEAVLLEDLRLVLAGDLLRFEGTAGLVPGEATASSGLDPEDALALLTAEQPFVYEIRVLMPGEVVETTGAGGPGEPLRWIVAPGEEVRLLAVAEQPQAYPWAVAASVAAGVLLALVCGLALTRRRRRRQALRVRSVASWR